MEDLNNRKSRSKWERVTQPSRMNWIIGQLKANRYPNTTKVVEHFGVNLTYSRGPLPGAAIEQLRRRRPDLDPADLVPQSLMALHARIDEWLAAGFSKFLPRPAVPPTDWTAELETLAADILERQT